MAINYRVTEQAVKVAEAYASGDQKALKIEKDNYWKILEVELMKYPKNGWVDLEDPYDSLYDCIENEDPKEMVSMVLEDYVRFHSILKKCGSFDRYDVELVEKANAYINA